MSSRGVNAPRLFGVAAIWSDRQRCWRWRLDPLTACAYQTPTGGWYLSGAINSFHVASRTHATLQRATDDLERHLVSLYRRLGRLIAKGASSP